MYSQTVLQEWSHRIWNPQAKTNPNVRTTVDFENGNTVVTALIGGQRHNATFPGKQIVTTTRYILKTEKGTELGNFEISIGNQTYIYKTSDGQTIVTDGQGKPVVNGDPFNISTNNTVGTTNYTIDKSV